MNLLRLWFAPNRLLGHSQWQFMIFVQVVAFFTIWWSANFPLLPKPDEILISWWTLVKDGLPFELISSLVLCMEATAITVVVSLILVYAAVMSFFKPWTTLFSKLRFNSLVGLTLF